MPSIELIKLMGVKASQTSMKCLKGDKALPSKSGSIARSGCVKSVRPSKSQTNFIEKNKRQIGTY